MTDFMADEGKYMENRIALLIGPSGSGKTTIAEYLHSHYGLHQIESYTTRPPRYPGEGGHIFVSEQEFDQLQDLVAYTEFDGNRYCATATQVEKSDIYVVDIAGAEYFKVAYHGSKEPIVFYLSVPEEERIRRMRDRGDSEQAIEQRICNDKKMFEDAGRRLKPLYSEVWLIENDDIAKAVQKIVRCLKPTFQEI